MTVPSVRLRPGRDRSVRWRHPWVYSGALGRLEDAAEDGDVVDVRSADGAWLARGVLNRHSQIAVRLLTWHEDEVVDGTLWARRVRAAIDRRSPLLDSGVTDAVRLVHAEADGLPGLVVDRFADVVVVQALSLAADRAVGDVVAELETRLAPHAVLHRSDEVMRTKEGLGDREPVLAGRMPDAAVSITERGIVFEVDVTAGHKTGFYLDQRDNRRLVAVHCADAEVLDAFCYTGGFSAAAAAGGARSITQVESSSAALETARHHLVRNGFEKVPLEQVHGDAFAELRRMRDAVRAFDVVILDPPKFAPTRARLERALRGYKDVNLQALKLVRPGGLLATFSCSGAVDRETFQTVVFQAAVDAGREVRILTDLGQPEDHPVLLTFPESRYLKGLLCRVE